MSRKTARQHAFAFIFQYPFHTPCEPDYFNEALQNYLAYAVETVPDINAEDTGFIVSEAQGVWTCMATLDTQIASLLKDWRIERLARMDLAILRLALYEMRYATDIPISVSINEAVELAKLYGTDDSPVFINGLLGEAVGRMDKERPGNCHAE